MSTSDFLFGDEDLTLKHTTHCGYCKRYNHALSPMLEAQGNSTNGIMLILPEPCNTEDTKSCAGVGFANDWLKSVLYNIGIEWDECCIVNAVGCAGNKPTAKQEDYCINRLEKVITEKKPKLILAFGNTALEMTVGMEWHKSLGDIGRWRGMIIPNHKWNCYIAPVFSLYDICDRDYYKYISFPKEQSLQDDFALVRENNMFKTLKLFFERDVQRAYKQSKKPLPINLNNPKYIKVLSDEESISYMESAYETLKDDPVNFVTIDYETTGLQPYNKGHKIRTVGMCYKDFEAVSFELTYKNIDTFKKFISCDTIRKANANTGFEWTWTKKILGINSKNWFHDVIIYQHYVDMRNMGITGLKFQAYTKLGILDYESSVHSYLEAENPNDLNDIYNAPIQPLCYYNAMDVLTTRWIAKMQLEHFENLDVKNKEHAYKVLMQGAISLAKLSYNGLPIDVTYMNEKIAFCENEIKALEKKLWDSEIGKKWKEKYKESASLVSVPQTIDILTVEFKLWARGVSHKKSATASKDFIERIDHPWVKDYLRYKKLEKLLNTYLLNFRKLMDENHIVHTSYTLNRASSLRSTSTEPNFQNLASRDAESVEIVKGCIKAPDGFRFSEADMSAAEVRMSTIFTQDDTLIEYLNNDVDFHGFTAQDAFIYTPEEWDELKEVSPKIHKTNRFHAKNKGVFAFLYGSTGENVGYALWDTVNNDNLYFNKDITMREHLMEKLNMNERYAKDCKNPKFYNTLGFTEKEEYFFYYYQEHASKVYDLFWKSRFKTYSQWKNDNYSAYLNQGYLDSWFGIRYEIIMRRTQTSNLGNQGATFLACMLETLNNLFDIIERNHLEYVIKPSGQVHDSCISFVKDEYFPKYCRTISRLMTKDIHKRNDFIIPVKMLCEVEASEIGGRWSEKKEFTDF